MTLELYQIERHYANTTSDHPLVLSLLFLSPHPEEELLSSSHGHNTMRRSITGPLT